MRPRSLRARLTLLAIAVVVVVLTAASAVIIGWQRSQLIANVDDSLQRQADELTPVLDDESAGELSARGNDRFTQIIGQDGSAIAASPNLAGAGPVTDTTALADLGEDGRYLTSSRVPIEDDRYRLLLLPLADGRILVVGENIDDLRETLVALTAALSLMVAVASALLGGVAWFLVGRTLAPVAAIRREVDHITLQRLGERIPVPDTSDEIAQLAETMNSMLDRLDRASERQRHFVGDASHELRSPLTRLRTWLEVDLADPARDLNVTGHDLLADIDDLQQIVDDLLFLARADAHVPLPTEVVDLDAVVDRVAGTLGTDEGVGIDTAGVEPVRIRGNEAQLVRLVTNLVANAVRHAERGVSIAVRHDGAEASIVVDDDGPGIPAEDRDRVFERFTRLDEARTGHAGGAGLGLAIAAEIAASHRGQLTVEDAPDGGARFTARFPAVQG